MPELLEYTAVGRRKESVARVRLRPGSGNVKVNKRKFDNFFTRETHRIIVMKPMEVTGMIDKYDVIATIDGGGISGQAGALRHGIARALVKSDDGLRLALKKSGFLTRDPRAKERKKYGQKRARKNFQFSKR
ncbi:MAG: 30S ribosomal protein S9 [Candidatus Omnitrophica bacterium]|nr:30S ribosomal protein S9 [Candidatus Omnitrophota bacterium]